MVDRRDRRIRPVPYRTAGRPAPERPDRAGQDRQNQALWQRIASRLFPDKT